MCGPKIYRFLGGINRAMLGVPAEVASCDCVTTPLVYWFDNGMQCNILYKSNKSLNEDTYVSLFPHQHTGNDTIAILICGFRSVDVSHGKIIKHLMLQAFTTDGHEA